jgi:hypothetical protein
VPEPEGSSPFSQEPTTGPYPEPTESTLHVWISTTAENQSLSTSPVFHISCCLFGHENSTFCMRLTVLQKFWKNQSLNLQPTRNIIDVCTSEEPGCNDVSHCPHGCLQRSAKNLHFTTLEQDMMKLSVSGPDILNYQLQHYSADITPVWKKDCCMWLWKSVIKARRQKRQLGMFNWSEYTPILHAALLEETSQNVITWIYSTGKERNNLILSVMQYFRKCNITEPCHQLHLFKQF